MLAHKSPYWSAFPYLLTVWLSASNSIAQEIHYSPEERLDAIDSTLIATAQRRFSLVANLARLDRPAFDGESGPAADLVRGVLANFQRKSGLLYRADLGPTCYRGSSADFP
jgi:hypothetical protein